MSEPTRRDIVKTLAAGSAAVTAGCLQVKRVCRGEDKNEDETAISYSGTLAIAGHWPLANR